MTVIPLDDRILVRPADGHGARAHTAPLEPADTGLVRGTVIAVGTGLLVSGRRTTPLAVQAGDTILFARHRGSEVTFGGVHYWMMKAEDVVTIVIRAVPVALYGPTPTPS